MAKIFLTQNSWAFDSTFKTNQYGWPLFAAIVPNKDGNGISVFYMLCSIDKQQGHEEIAMKLTLTHIF